MFNWVLSVLFSWMVFYFRILESPCTIRVYHLLVVCVPRLIFVCWQDGKHHVLQFLGALTIVGLFCCHIEAGNYVCLDVFCVNFVNSNRHTNTAFSAPVLDCSWRNKTAHLCTRFLVIILLLFNYYCIGFCTRISSTIETYSSTKWTPWKSERRDT